MTRKFALLIGNSQYQDSVLAKLKAPDSDVAELAKILKDPAVGGFDQVISVFSEVSTVVRVEIANFFAEKKREDLLLLYFSGHGVLDDQGRFYLAAKDTRHNLLNATGIPASFIRDEMESCRSRRQVLVLDCCHSGAFARGKGSIGLNAITQATFEGVGGYGQVVLTATDATQYALEGDQVIGNVETSLFTHFLIQGLRSGEADMDRDGRITLDELYDYVFDHVRAETHQQTPRKWEHAREGDELVIARSRFWPADLAPELRYAIESGLPSVREGAVHELDHLLRGSDRSLARLARGILKALAREDDSLRVRSAAEGVLKIYEDSRPPKPGTSPVPTATSDLKPLPSIPPTPGVKAPLMQNPAKPSRGKWALWAGITASVLILTTAYWFSNFAALPAAEPPTETSPASSTEMPASVATATSDQSNALTLLVPTDQSITGTATVTPSLPVSTDTALMPATRPGGPGSSRSDPPTAAPVLPTFTPWPTPNTPTVVPTTVPLNVLNITPDAVQANTTVNLTISGTGFANGATVHFESGQGSPPQVTAIEVINANTIVITVNVMSDVNFNAQLWDVRVTNPNSTFAILPNAFTVTGP